MAIFQALRERQTGGGATMVALRTNAHPRRYRKAVHPARLRRHQPSRAITTEAAVNLAAVNYHFGSKEELFALVLTTRLTCLGTVRPAGCAAAGISVSLHSVEQHHRGCSARRCNWRVTTSAAAVISC